MEKKNIDFSFDADFGEDDENLTTEEKLKEIEKLEIQEALDERIELNEPEILEVIKKEEINKLEETLANMKQYDKIKKEINEPINPTNEVKDIMGNIMEDMNKVNIDDPDSTGDVLANMFKKMTKLTTNMLKNNNGPEDFLKALCGEDLHQKIVRQQNVCTFLQNSLREMSLKDAILKTKEEFDLPDDYEVKLEMTVKFSIQDQKNTIPDMD
jgi:hypothetical protein